MITQLKEIYKCEYCRKLYQIKKFAQMHEDACFKNPENNRACLDCEFLKKKTTEVFSDHPYEGETSRLVNLFYCSKKQIFLYPPKVEHKGNQFDLEDDLNEKMPKICELYVKQD